eukprot:scaffold841_cov397-Prasinococcus_capsulatus_cf.AAC.8
MMRHHKNLMKHGEPAPQRLACLQRHDGYGRIACRGGDDKARVCFAEVVHRQPCGQGVAWVVLRISLGNARALAARLLPSTERARGSKLGPWRETTAVQEVGIAAGVHIVVSASGMLSASNVDRQQRAYAHQQRPTHGSPS